MSVQLDSLIGILRENAECLEEGAVCSLLACSNINCSECPFNDAKSVHNLVEELEVLQHAKA